MNQNREESNAVRKDLISKAVNLGYKGPLNAPSFELECWVALNDKKTHRHKLYNLAKSLGYRGYTSSKSENLRKFIRDKTEDTPIQRKTKSNLTKPRRICSEKRK